MAAVEVTITGMLYDRVNRTTQNVVLVGEASLTNVGVGGGPVIPPEGEKPPGIWPSPGHPTHPIVPGGRPPGFWGPTDPRPGWGLPEPPTEPPTTPPDGNGFVKPPPEDGGWSYHQTYGWGYYPAAGAAGPK